MSERREVDPGGDFVLVRLVHAAEYVHARLEERADGFVPVKPTRDQTSGQQSPEGRSSSPHYSSPLPGRGEPTTGLDPPQHSPPQEPGPNQTQIMVLQSRAEISASSAVADSDVDLGPWASAPLSSDPSSSFSMWPPALLDQALRLGVLDSCSAPRLFGHEAGPCTAPSSLWEVRKDQDIVMPLARRLGQIGEEREAGNCSCHGTIAGRRPDQRLLTSDALLVLQGRNAEAPEWTQPGLSQAGLDQTEQDQISFNQSRLNSVGLNGTGRNHSLDRITGRGQEQIPESESQSQPQSRAPTPKLSLASGGRSLSPLMNLDLDKHNSRSREKTRRGSLKVRLSRLFRTRSSGAGPVLDKRPSLASSTSSGGSLLDVWGSSSSTQEQDSTRLQVLRPLCAFAPVAFTPAFTGETVSLVDVDISLRNTFHPPTPPPPPRRSLSLLDDFAGPAPQSAFLGRGSGRVSMQSLPPRSLVLPPAVRTMQHSLSLNEAFLSGLSRPIPLYPPRPTPHCSLNQSDASACCPHSQLDASRFTTSLKELEKCGWYWGPMKWDDAELKLKGRADGSFLVRDSSDPRYILSLSFRSQSVTHHTRLEHYRGTFSLWCHPRFESRCHSVVEFIERAIAHSKNGKFLYFLRSRVPGLPPTPVQLLYPVSRFSSVKTLQHLCRFCIRQTVRVDHIQNLPLPIPLISYVKKFYYYDTEEEVTVTAT